MSFMSVILIVFREKKRIVISLLKCKNYRRISAATIIIIGSYEKVCFLGRKQLKVSFGFKSVCGYRFEYYARHWLSMLLRRKFIRALKYDF